MEPERFHWDDTQSVEKRAAQIFKQHAEELNLWISQRFAILMALQWIMGIVFAVYVSPQTWAGSRSQIHIHVYAAIFLGGMIASFPIFCALYRSKHWLTPHVIAIGQMLASALLIHLTGGRIETHFHVFGSLAFLAYYKDWKVILSATAVVAFDHAFRGIYWPESVYGITVVQPWRFLEHAGWVVFEDIFLLNSIAEGLKDVRRAALRQAELEIVNSLIETKVQERTTALALANKKISENQKQLTQSEKMSAVGQLAAGVAHEINNPLGIILGFAQGLAQRLKAGDVLEVPIKSIEREALRCKNLVQDLLTFSRAYQQNQVPMDLNLAIEGSLSLINASSKMNSVEIHKDLGPSLPQIIGNLNQIQQIVINLANNAIDAMPKGGVLGVQTSVQSNDGYTWIQLIISDTGKGIDKEIQSKIFDPFFTTKPVGKGTGLGLSLVYDIVKKHSGSIDLESEPGLTRFRIKFPKIENL